MKTRGRGVIINIIGNAGDQRPAYYAAGISANSALAALTRALTPALTRRSAGRASTTVCGSSGSAPAT
jgi:hypothetical protein